MDILTQGLLGAALAQTTAKKDETKIASVIGFLSGLLADADVLIRSSNDSLLAIEYHRHFTHSFLFVPLGALIASLLLWPFMKRHLTFPRLYLFSFMGYSLSGFLDACTSYGTHLFWPILDERISFHIISIVDPVFTLTLLAACILTIKYRHTLFAKSGLALVAIYLSIGWLQLQRAESVIEDYAMQRGHTINQLVVKPTLANLLLWRSIYRHDGHFYVDAIRVGLFAEPRVYEGSSTRVFDLQNDMVGLAKASVLYKDIKRFVLFSDDYVAFHPDYNNVLGDIRYSNQPTGLDPLWGIEFTPAKPDEHARFSIYRNLTREHRQRFFDMILNRQL